MVLGDLLPIPNYLHYFDLVICPAQNPTAKDKRILDGKLRYPEDGHFNGGVFAFRRGEAMEAFFSLWNQRLRALGYAQDQPALVEAYSLGSARIFPLPNRWNSGGRSYDRRNARQTIIIWHYKSRIEPIVEDVMIRAIGWVEGGEKQLRDTQQFIEKRLRQWRANSILWDFRRFVTRMRGNQSGLLQNHPSRDQWLRWLREE
jgi:hypothetical protein